MYSEETNQVKGDPQRFKPIFHFSLNVGGFNVFFQFPTLIDHISPSIWYNYSRGLEEFACSFTWLNVVIIPTRWPLAMNWGAGIIENPAGMGRRSGIREFNGCLIIGQQSIHQYPNYWFWSDLHKVTKTKWQFLLQKVFLCFFSGSFGHH